MKRIIYLIILIIFLSVNIYSWEDHAQITYYSLQTSEFYDLLNKKVQVKSLFDFVFNNFEDLQKFFEDLNNRLEKSGFFKNEIEKLRITFNINSLRDFFLKFYFDVYSKEDDKIKETYKLIIKSPKEIDDLVNIINKSLYGYDKNIDQKELLKNKELVELLEKYFNVDKSKIKAFDKSIFTKNKIFRYIYEKYFLFSLKINPSYNIKYFIKENMNKDYNHSFNISQNKEIEFKDIAFAYYLNRYHKFYNVNEDQKVNAIEVLSTASDEPDYGLDISLFEDNGSEWGKMYKLGTQPFGNPKLAYGTQAPFHMAFYHESKALTKLIPDLKRSYVLYRIFVLSELAKFCFEKGEDYWGFRFAGWALHYIMDMSQPYHSSVVPGKSTFYLIFAGILDKIGIHSLKNNLLNDITYKHTLIEGLQMEYLNLYLKGDSGKDYNKSEVFISIKDSKYNNEFNYSDIIDIITKEAKNDGKETDKILTKLIKNKKNYKNILTIMENENYNIYDIIYDENTRQYKSFELLLAKLLKKVSSNTRTYLNWLIRK